MNAKPTRLLLLEDNEFLVNDTVDRLTLLNIKGREAINPANGNECAIIQENNNESQICEQAGLTVWEHADFIALALSAEIRNRAGKGDRSRGSGNRLGRNRQGNSGLGNGSGFGNNPSSGKGISIVLGISVARFAISIPVISAIIL